MSADTLLVILVLTITVAVLLQAFAMWQAARAATQLVNRLDRQSRELEQEAREMLSRVRSIADRMEPLAEVAETVKTNVDSLSVLVKARAENVDAFIQEMAQVGREQALKIDHVVTDTVQKFEQTTEVIQRDVLRPALEVSSFVKGVRAGISYLFNKRGSRPDETHSEEEMFI